MGAAGIIPARAGFTPPFGGEPGDAQDHPRSRGVYMVPPSSGHGGIGSSPLARGLPGAPPPARRHPRIIPARAGFTPSPATRAPGAWDHPRSRGVYVDGSPASQLVRGSSPLARGLPRPVARLPVAAGDHPRSRGVYGPPTEPLGREVMDHPRSRGVYGLSSGSLAMSIGSSPLARGLRSRLRRRDGEVGIIPARAGFTISAASC